jgi:oxepin-CoA hydrolase/3-oxo-5,6-dehydrosuberyl-CoA semialdehyde dehydrogenase
VSYKTGATKADSWVDIEGGIGNVFANASLRKQLGNMPFYVDGPTRAHQPGGTFMGHHIMVPKEGVAVHINAFNFPIWGMLEKCAVNWMAGMPAVVKPATVTSYLTEAMVKAIIESGSCPKAHCSSSSAAPVICWIMWMQPGRGHLHRQRHHGPHAEEAPAHHRRERALQHGGRQPQQHRARPDAVPGTEEFDLFIKEVGKEMTLKCGQRCTGARRILVPENLVEDVQIAIGKRLGGTVIGDPRAEGVRMGALAGPTQRKEVKRATRELMKGSRGRLRRSRQVTLPARMRTRAPS